MCSLAMLRADLHEGVEGAECDMKSQPLVEEAGDFAIRPPFAAKFADQFTVRLQFGARRLLRRIFENGSKFWFHCFGSRALRKSWSINSPIPALTMPERVFGRYPCRLVSITYETDDRFHGDNTGSNPVGDANQFSWLEAADDSSAPARDSVVTN